MKKQVTTQEAKQAVKTLISYITGEEASCTLKDTPARVIKSYKEIFAGYQLSPESILDKKFRNICQYDEAVYLKSVNFTSTCEHHLLPFYGTVDIAYIPNEEVIGISKLARLIDLFSKRLQLQERMTAQIAQSLQNILQPKGVAIRVKAMHSCMTSRGAQKADSFLESLYFTALYKESNIKKQEFLQSLK